VSIGSAQLAGDLLVATSTVVTIAPMGGFSGTVDLSIATVSGLTTKLDKSSLAVSGAAGTTANLTVTSSKSGAVAFQIVATSGATTVTKDLTFTATKTLTLYIPADAQMNKGTVANPYNTAFGPASGIVVSGAVPLTLNIVNKDATAHIIHASNVNGFFHGSSSSPIPQNGMDKTRTITGTGTYNFYLHDQGGALDTGKLILQ
jgi:hypothetical protein